MAAEVDICNLALAHLGDEANIAALDEGSAQADHCARFYAIARDQLLAMHAWGFATKRVALALLDTDELPSAWSYCYERPANCISVVAVFPVDNADSAIAADPLNPMFGEPTRAGDSNVQPFIQEVLQDGTRVVFTNVEDAVARYTASVTDTATFSPLFVTALSRLLASYLAGPVLKGETGMKVGQAQLKIFGQMEFPWASGIDAKNQRVSAYNNFLPDSLSYRR